MKYPGCLRSAALCSGILLLGACQTTPKGSTPSLPPSAAPTQSTVTAPAARYSIRADLSEVRFLVFRGGALATLGHNHVIQANEILGEIHLAKDFHQSQFWLTIPVAGLQVDAAEARSVEGEDFASQPDPEAIAATTKNMLGDKVLNSAQYPQIDMRSVSLVGPSWAPDATVRIKLRDKTRDLTFPVAIAYQEDRIVVTAVFAIDQTDFGITPFSILGGAIQVANTVRVRMRIVAQKS